ncbi:hypothetical protein KCP70_02620 [Salmonella enterica subsp. enterica]|nr:hypothetical protein KCP70_02620 [Salmonella enterica subsp. enterica]
MPPQNPVGLGFGHDAAAIDSAYWRSAFGLGAFNADLALFAGLAGYLVSIFCWHKTYTRSRSAKPMRY